MKKLNKPRGVCVSGQYVYVTNHYGHNVSVFTTEGEYVTSFGHCGDKDGEFVYPYGICAGNYIYIADFRNNRVQCF